MAVICLISPDVMSTAAISGAIDIEVIPETSTPDFRLSGPMLWTPSVTVSTFFAFRFILNICEVPRWEQLNQMF
jgi:hypothetical protein